MKKIADISLTIVIVGLLFLGYSIFSGEQREISHKENRWLYTNSRLNSEQINVGELRLTAEKILKDQFYWRDEMIDADYSIRLLFNKPFSHYSDGETDTIVLPDGILMLDDEYLVKDYEKKTEVNIQMCENRAYNVNEIKRIHPELGVFVYKPTTMTELIDPENNCSEEYWTTYKKQLWSGVRAKSMELESYEQYKELFYKSDNHWNGKGAYYGYSDLIDFLNDYYDIGDAKECTGEYVSEYDFHGDLGSKVPGYVADNDRLTDFIISDIGEFDYYEDGKLIENPYYKKDKYYKYGNYSLADGWLQTEYFIYNYSVLYEKVYDFHDENKPNILIFCDSFACANQEAIASHFNRSVFIDLRMDENQKFRLSEYLEEYDIDIVLVYQVYDDLYFQGNDFINLD